VSMAGDRDPVGLSQALIRCASVTPVDEGALDVLQAYLENLGFTCHRQVFSDQGTPDVDNLYARIGDAAPNICFAGHTDVVPIGNLDDWSVDPFAADIKDGVLYGRGASDMKCAIACFATAAARLLDRRGGELPGSISFLITGDEEGPAINGTVKMLNWLKEKGETLDHCLVGEPTSADTLGDMVKIGRRGSMNAMIEVYGTQGHSAYPQLADNPIPRLLDFLTSVNGEVLDTGTDHFPATNLEITTVDVGNRASNVIPPLARGLVNIRFNDRHTGDSLSAWLQQRRLELAGDSHMNISISGEAFLTPPGKLSGLIAEAIKSVTGLEPDLSTTGGTSDARFIKDFCPIAEFGMLNATAHKVDENVRVDEINTLTDIYEKFLDGYFEAV
jgi:succinyl-diaminopimelate desuccinylase